MKRPSAATWIPIALGFLIAILFLVSRSAGAEAAYPLERGKMAFSRQVLTRIQGLFRGAQASAENVRLRREVNALRLVKTDIDRLEAENARLRRALGYAQTHSEQWIPAGVLASQGGAVSAHETIRVDKGSLAGVSKGAIVAVPEGLVGQVTQVTPHTSEITLITDSSVKVACEMETQDLRRPRGILSGGSARFLVLRHMSNIDNIPLTPARVISSGRGGVFPRGLQIGSCNSRSGFVVPSVDFSSLEDVFIRREK